ncbi:MAG: phosphodiester glycosidase family protein [Acidobacteriota bacterium]
MSFRKMMILFLLVLVAGAQWILPVTAAEPITYSTIKVDGHPVTMLSMNPAQTGLKVRPVLANGKTGQTADLFSMAAGNKALAAVNGTFFNAYADMTSWGTICINGVLHRTGSGGAVVVYPDNRIRVAPITVVINGSVDGPSKASLKPWDSYLKTWYAWDINRNITDPKAVVVFTPSFGQRMQAPVAMTATIRNGMVTAVQSGQVPVPADGYVIGFGAGASNYSSRFTVGDRVEMKPQVSYVGGEPINLSGVNILQAGPMLVKNGQYGLSPQDEQKMEPKFYNKCSWSFAGIKNDGVTFVIGTVSGVNFKSMASTVQKLGMRDAVMLDGNASSGLYYKGKSLIKPGRKLSNCLIVTAP